MSIDVDPSIDPEWPSEVDESDVSDGQTESGRSSRLRRIPSRLRRIPPRWWAVLGASVLAVLLAASIVVLHVLHTRALDRDRQVIDSARSAAAILLTVDPAETRRYAEQVLTVTTGEFHDEFDRRQSDVASLLATGAGMTQAQALEAGISEWTDGATAIVLVTARTSPESDGVAVVRPDDGTDGTRTVRLRMTMTESGGTFKVSQVVIV
ncbi:hypothetical protein ABH922_002369 [Rhodococcus sp. 27YEA15]|uniref:hypothetical protein n=1 Tax=Rhodococcus sp. 27YEA15 TaxID=3156259 RepID=UPI003C7B2D1E